MGTEVGDSGASYSSSLWRFTQFRSLYYLKSALCSIASFGSVWPKLTELFINLPLEKHLIKELQSGYVTCTLFLFVKIV